MNCPRCDAHLERLAAKDMAFRGCGSCGGVWLDRRVWKRVRSARPKAVVAVAEQVAGRARRSVNTEGTAILCPECSSPMDPTRLAFAPIEVDVCPDHGVWFDRSELGQAVAALREEAAARRSSRTAAVAGGAAVAGAAVGAAALAGAPPPAAERAAAGSGDHSEALEVGADLLEAGVDVADSGLLDGLGSLLEGAGELVGGLLEGLSGL